MKKKIALLFAAAIFSITALVAQDGRQRMSPEERTKMTMEKMTPLNLSADVKTKAEKIMNDFYTAQQKAVQDMRASGTMDRDAMMATRKKLADERDAKLKEIFTQDQMKKWIDEIEPSLRPQRPAQN